MTQLEWDGSRLAGDLLALSVLTGVSETDGALGLVAAADSTRDRRVLIRPDQVGGFLLEHREALFVCHEAGPFFWAVAEHLDRDRDRAALEVLWDLPRTGRLHDVRLLDQLVRLAEGSVRPRAEPLHKLAASRLKVRLSEDGDLRARLTKLAGDPSRRQEGLHEELCRRADVTLGLYRSLLGRVEQIVRGAGIRPETVKKFGPLSLNLQVQCSIALAASRRNGLYVDKATSRRIVRACNVARTDAAVRLWADPEARPCFAQDGQRLVPNKNGFLDPEPVALRSWLTSLASVLTLLHDMPVIFPGLQETRRTPDPEDWEVLARCHPPLWAWAEHAKATRLHRYFVRHEEGVVRPEYEPLPALRSAAPDLNALFRIVGDGVFRPRPGHRFLVVRLNDLVLRALAAVLDHRFPGESELARVFRQGLDPHDYAASRLGELHPDLFGADASRQRGHSLMRSHLVPALLFAVPQGLGEHNLKTICARDNHFPLSGVEAHKLHRCLIEEVFPELEVYLNDDTIRRLGQAFGCPPEECLHKLRLPVRRLVRITCLSFVKLVQCLNYAGFDQHATDRSEVPGSLEPHGRADVSTVGCRGGSGLRLGWGACGE